MKSNWQTKKLSEICIIKPAKHEVRNKLNENEFVSFIPMEDLGILNKNINAVKERRLKDIYSSYTYC